GTVRPLIGHRCSERGCFEDWGAAWSPNGTRIAVSRFLPSSVSGTTSSASLVVVNRDGTEPRTIYECSGSDCAGVIQPTWSPDGSTIAFGRYRTPTIQLVPSRGGTVRDIPTCTSAAGPITACPNAT